MEDIIYHVYDIATKDSTLKSLMGGEVLMYPDIAEDDSPFPYLVFWLDAQDAPEGPWGIYIGVLNIEIWVHGPHMDLMWSIRRRLVELYQRRFYETVAVNNVPSTTIDCWRMWKDRTEMPLAKTMKIRSDRVWGRLLRFGMRWVDRGEHAAVVSRNPVS